MARQVTEFSVFVASPSDVEEEVARLANVICRLNSEWESQGMRFRLVTWQTHVDPAFGDDPQTVVNQQIPPDYDIFIGILWSRVGTPTDRAESGTIEEFWRAKERYDEDPHSVTLMLYFKEAPVPLSQIHPEQIQAVRDFRDRLGEEGGLYRKFETISEFDSAVHLHLARYLQGKRSSGAVVAGLVVANDRPAYEAPQPVPDDEPGLLDLQEEFESEFAGLRETAEEMAAAIQEFGEMANRRTADLEKAQKQPNFEAVKRKVLRNVANSTAAGMSEYVARTESILPRFTSHLDRGVAAFGRAIPMQGQIAGISADDREQLKAVVSSLRGSLHNAVDGLERFKGSVVRTPAMTRAMARSRRATTEVLERQIDALRRADLQLSDVESLIADLPGNEDEELSKLEGQAPARG